MAGDVWALQVGRLGRRLTHDETHLHELSAPDQLQRELAPRRHTAQQTVQRIDAVHRLPVHRDDEISREQLGGRGRS